MEGSAERGRVSERNCFIHEGVNIPLPSANREPRESPPCLSMIT